MSARSSGQSNKSSTLVQLLYAVQNNFLFNVQEVLLFIDKDELNRPCGPLQINALQVACTLSNDASFPMVQLLLSHGADPSKRDKLGRTPLHYAATNGNYEVVKLLLESGADINAKYEINSFKNREEEKNYINEKVEQEHIESLPLPECWGRTALHQAVKYNHKPVVKLLLERQADVNALDEHQVSPLLLAGAAVLKDKHSLSVYEDIVEILLEYEADVNLSNVHTGTTALHHSVALESYKVTKLLLDALAKIQEAGCGQTPLHEAAERGNRQILHLLLTYEARQINKPDNKGRTALHKAAFAGSRECVELLVEYGADLSVGTNSDMTVIDAIYKFVPRPTNLIRGILNSKICCNHIYMNNVDFKLDLDFRVLAPRGSNKQMSVIAALLELENDKPKNELIQHPLIETYLLLKWQRLRMFFTLLVLTYIVFVISLSIYIILVIHEVPGAEFFIELSRSVLLISAFSLLTHDVIQCVLMPRHYIYQYEMWLNLVCALLSFIIGIFADSSLKEVRKGGSDYSASWILHIMSITVLLAWMELMLLIGRFPSYGYYALMFSTVLQNVVKVLLTFVCLVIGFALSFSVQFHTFEQFNDPWRALVKTTVMMMGEFEYADLFTMPENANSTTTVGLRLPGTSRFIFLMFIILASIVLMNLMVGIAVNDIQALRTAGHVQRSVKQAIFLTHLETVLSHKILKSDWVPGELYKMLYSRRCIPIQLTIRPSAVSNCSYDRYRKLIPNCLMESLIEMALSNRKMELGVDENDSNVLPVLRNLEQQILEIKQMISSINLHQTLTQ